MTPVDERTVAQQRDFDAVLEGAKKGEHWAVALLFEDVQPRLLRYLRSRDHSVADDIAGEVWEAVARGIRTFEGDDSDFRGWAFTIARRRLIDHRRKRERRKTDLADDTTFTALPGPETADRAAIDHLSAQDAIAVITSCLTEEQAEVVLLRVVGGMATHLVAEAMQRSESWVRVTQHRAMKRLADQVDRDLAPLGVTGHPRHTM